MTAVQPPVRVAMTPGALRVRAAADRLFYKRGIHAVGVDLIAAEAGVTKKTIYDRFGSKEQLVVEYLADRDERWSARLSEALERAPSDARHQVSAVFEAAAAWMAEDSPRGCSMINARAEITDAEHPARAVIDGQKARMLALFTDLAGRVAPDDADRLGRTLLLLHEGALVAHGLGLFPDPIRHAREAAEALLGTADG
ncbi:TetR/AcrR family transcriptional regulator [Plantactinospora siamensis]|uniref:TetR/AcrR family transcriptional regulator n=1 Tax=Plantactinospora siamensis TaxID=555372 RepID=A0ABV6P0R1_9ACTN